MDANTIVTLVVTLIVSSGILGVLTKLAIGWIGDKLGWDETKKLQWQNKVESLAQTGIHYAEEAAKHKVFTDPAERAKFKEKLAVDFLSKQADVDEETAKALVRAVFSTSSLSKPHMAHDKALKFEDEMDPEKLIE